jgi:hypothetical protein
MSVKTIGFREYFVDFGGGRREVFRSDYVLENPVLVS